MYLSENEIKELAQNKETVLRSFLEKRIPEGYYLDYKIELSRKADKDEKREFLKDVTGFANANGGNIIIGAQEPAEALALEDQLIGILDGDKIAHNLERLASSSIDPRIPGLRILPVALSIGGSKSRYAIVVHIPPSLGRPHMVNYKDEKGKEHKTFYVRHTESTVSMSTHEVRESVFASASAEARVKDYLERMEKDASQYFIESSPTFLMQAMPLLSHVQPWNVLGDKIRSVLCDHQRHQKYEPEFALMCYSTSATLDGIKGEGSGNNPNWVVEVHRNGYISLTYKKEKKKFYDSEEYFLHKKDCNLFKAFCDICKDVIAIMDSDSTYILRCKLLNAREVVLLYSSSWSPNLPDKKGPYGKREMIWHDQAHQVGEGFEPIIEKWSIQLFNAFGLDGPT